MLSSRELRLLSRTYLTIGRNKKSSLSQRLCRHMCSLGTPLFLGEHDFYPRQQRVKPCVCSEVTYLFHHYSEFALLAEDRLHAIQPLHTGEDLSWPDEHLTRVKSVRLIKKQPLTYSRKMMMPRISVFNMNNYPNPKATFQPGGSPHLKGELG